MATQRGRVAASNDKGIRLQGAEGWLNYSKFGGPFPPVQRGDTVEVVLDQAGFIRKLVVLEPDEPPEPELAPESPTPRGGDVHGLSRDRLIARHVALKAAVSYVGVLLEHAPADERESTVWIRDYVLPIAESFEAWLLRPEQPADR